MDRVGRSCWGAGLRPSLSTAFIMGRTAGSRLQVKGTPGHKNGSCRMKILQQACCTHQNTPDCSGLGVKKKKKVHFSASTKSSESSLGILSPSRSQGARFHLPVPSKWRPLSSRSPLRVQGLLRLPDGISRKLGRSRRAQFLAVMLLHPCHRPEHRLMAATNAGSWDTQSYLAGHPR